MNVLEQKQWEEFIAKGLPSSRDERWKYTDLAFLTKKNMVAGKRLEAEYLRDKVSQHRLTQEENILLVFVNGFFMPTLSDIDKLPSGVIARSLNEALVDCPALVKQHWLGQINAKQYPFGRLNTTLFRDGLFLCLPNHCEITKPVHLLSIAAEDNEFIAHPHNLIAIGDHSQLTLFEENVSMTAKPYMMNIVSGFSVGESATLNYYKIQTENIHAVHMANTFINQRKNSNVDVTMISSGGLYSRDDLIVSLDDTGAHCRAAGLYYLTRDNQYIDHHVDIAHAASHSESDMLYKGILNKKSKGVFNGRLCVKRDAQKIVAHQANHNLLLSSDAEVYAKPELEIDADDVQCKHGATTGQLDQEALFYMQSRGINQAEAKRILLHGFTEEIFKRIAHPEINQRARASALC